MTNSNRRLAIPKHMKRLLASTALLTFLGIGTESYAQSDVSEELGAEIRQPETLAVLIQSGRFSEKKIIVHVGDTIVWTNTTTIKHTVTADVAFAKNAADVILPIDAEPFHSGLLTPGQTFTHTFTVPGLYQYVCVPHELHGMIAQVEVLP